MNIRFLYYEDCPSHTAALDRLNQVLDEEGVEVTIKITKVETEDQAQKLKFTGSPTILINGQDIDPPPPQTHYRLTCRVYQLDDGRISPLPSSDMIRQAIRRAQT